HQLRIHSLIETNRLAEAETAAKEGWKHCAGDPALVGLQIQIDLRQKREKEAVAFATRAREQFPKQPHAPYLVAAAYAALGKRDEALALLSGPVSDDPTNRADAHLYLRLLVEAGQTGNLEETLEKVLAANPQHPLILSVLIEYHATRNDFTRSKPL